MSDVHEMKTLTLAGEEFNSFPDQQARGDILKKLPLPEGAAAVGQYLRVLSVDEAGKITALETADAPDGESGGSSGGGSGGSGETEPTAHGIVWDLVNVTSSNPIASVSDGASLVAVLTPADGYTLGDVIVTMGGEVLTGVWNADTQTVMIVSVTGDVVIFCNAIENATEDLKTVAGFSSSSNAYPTLAENGDGTYTADWTGLKIIDASIATGGDYFLWCFGQSVSGGVLCIDFANTPITKLETKIQLVAEPFVPTFGVAADYHSDNWLSDNGGYTGTEGEIDFKATGSGASSLHLTGNVRIKIPDGYYPMVYFRRSQSAASDETIMASNGAFTKYVYDNVSVTCEAGTGAEAEDVMTVDEDYAMDYGVSTLSLVTDAAASTKTGLDATYAAVIEEAKNAWLTEANGSIDKIPLIIHTDQHSNFSKPLWDFIGEIVDWYDVGKVINLGDTVNSYGGDLLTDSGLEKYIESMESVPYSKRIEVFGNHDTWGNNEDGTGRFTPQNYLHKYFRNIYARRFDNHGNFVTYDDNYNVKYVVVSGFAYDSEKGGYSHYIIPSATIDRIIMELEKADGYDVILLSHVPLSGVNNKSLNDLWSGRKAKTSGSVTDECGVSHAFDFTDCDGELLCGLHGHNHADGHTQIGELVDIWFDAWYISPNAFHFVLVDRANKELNVWKVDNSPRYENYQIALDVSTATYSIINTLTNVTNTSCMIAAIENRAYSANLTADSGYTLDSVTVTMGGTDVTADVYADGVVTIAAVTGDVVITASATATETTTE